MDSVTVDVCIIGGNIAGAYLSYLISKERKDLKISVIEEHEITGKPVQCTGIMSQKLLDILDIKEDETVAYIIPSDKSQNKDKRIVRKNIILNRIKKARIVGPDKSCIEMSGKEIPVVVDRSVLDYKYYKLAEGNGVKFYFNEKFITYRLPKGNNSKDLVIIKTNKRTIKAKIIVGCDGPLSKVARLNGVKHNIIYGTQLVMKLKYPRDTTALYFDQDWKELFGWIVPESEGICRVGLACRYQPRLAFKKFLKRILPDLIQKEEQKIVPNNNSGVEAFEELIDRLTIKKQGGLIPIGYIRHIAFKRAILLGDSACMVKASTGGGVVMLTTAAKIASKAIIKAFERGRFDKSFFQRNYEDKIKRKIGLELKLHYLIRQLLINFDTADYNRFFRLYRENSSIKLIIKEYADMDFPKRVLLKLIFNYSFLRFILQILMKNKKLTPEIISIIAGHYKLWAGNKRAGGSSN
ncbi:MAG: hypothetical protein ACTSU2_09035 [Promethearchaeota archaeon]